ncbi:(Fe-S)-binding protein [Sporolactobacillus shoreae]|uniref:Glycolate oxidase iron-sulfur subunit n=1 Tax=Sporolactobacillus shoreae TaxID=1465501 RepID=A0A4Z0GST2_9BACL|nr:(Fe-S)-binding protein [Sporolactobacillus shoreae]TGA99289.1 (Fe-S)-binding protein [Sporolactobacillus shoreae]
MNEDPREKLNYDATFSCIQCGSCLPACPTYKTMGTETQSPRGRINLVKMAAEGKITLDELKEPIDLCLGCRACERVCPTNVAYGKILDSAKVALNEHEQVSVKKFQEDIYYNQVFSKKNVMGAGANLLWFYQKSGLRSLAEKTHLNHLLPESIATFEEILPSVSSPLHRHHRPDRIEPKQTPRYKVGFFKGCIMDALFDRINDLGMRLLAAGGCTVVAVDGQTCCGALHHHGGRTQQAKELAKQNIEAFETEAFDYVINTAGGCGAMLHEYPELFADDPSWEKRAEAFAARSIDISELLARLDLPVEKEIRKRVTYQPSCHMTNVQKVVDEPKQLIHSVRGIDFRELDNPDFCCGSAGIYNVVHFDESMKILDVKMGDVKARNPELIVTTNPGCLLQMKAGIEREGLQDHVRAIHLVELLAAACGLEDEDK